MNIPGRAVNRASPGPVRQSSTLLPTLFQQLEEREHLEVLHLGPAMPETVDFFSRFRCRLHFADVFTELPLPDLDAEDGPDPEQWWQDVLGLPEHTELDFCLLWDSLDFLGPQWIEPLVRVLRRHLHHHSLGFAYSVRNTRAPQSRNRYALLEATTVVVRERDYDLPGYQPQSQRQMGELLKCFRVERSVLLGDGRMEVLLRARL